MKLHTTAYDGQNVHILVNVLPCVFQFDIK